MNKGPVIKDFGAVFDVASPDYKTPIDADYKVLFNVHQAATSPSDVNEGLDTVARFLNMHAAAGVPRARMQVAVVLHGPAGRIRCGTRRTKPDSASKTRTCHSSPSAGTRDTLCYVGELVSGDQPPSARRRDAGVAPQRAGRTGSLKDLDRVLHRSWRMARPGRASVTFGAPLSLTGQDYISLASASPRPSCDRSLRGSIEDTRNEIASSERADSVWDCPSLRIAWKR